MDTIIATAIGEMIAKDSSPAFIVAALNKLLQQKQLTIKRLTNEQPYYWEIILVDKGRLTVELSLVATLLELEVHSAQLQLEYRSNVAVDFWKHAQYVLGNN